jgi:hypothetical protein
MHCKECQIERERKTSRYRNREAYQIHRVETSKSNAGRSRWRVPLLRNAKGRRKRYN